MAVEVFFHGGLTALIVVLVLVHQARSTNATHDHCPPSFCGNISNISYPFRLETDPENCGNQKYNLACENNQTVLYLHSGKYNVKEINYTDYTIRVVDSGIQENNGSFISAHSLDWVNFSMGDPYSLYYYSGVYISCSGSYYGVDDFFPSSLISGPTMVFLNCEKPAISPHYLDMSTCSSNGVSSSNSSLSASQGYRYVLTDPSREDLEDLCRVEKILLTSSPDHYPNTCANVYYQLGYGFKLSWVQGMCDNYTDTGLCILDGANFTDRCNRLTRGFISRLLSRLLTKFIEFLGPLVVSIYDSEGRLYRLYDRGVREYAFDKYGRAGGIRVLTFATLLYVLLYHQTVKTILGAPFVMAFLTYKWWKRHLSEYDVIEEFLVRNNNLMPIRYLYSDIKKMTKSFKDKLGEGGYGSVLKGTLQSGCLVAVKMLCNSKANGQDFMSEVATIGRIHHTNIVQLIGFCVEGSKQALVYEFMPNGSLNKYIFSQVSTPLSYDKMFHIALGVAHGIEYLHRGCEMQILHFDIKPHNILLDEKFTPKVSDFGLAKFSLVNDSVISLTAARGTLGYMAPELFYKNIGGISYKADVYSFGMLLMEMAGKRKNLNAYANCSSQIYFPTGAYDRLHDGKDIEIEEATKEENKIVQKMIIIALWCIQMKPSDCPSMNKVIQMFEEDVECLQMPPRPFLANVNGNLDSTCSSIQLDESSHST